MNGDYIGNTNYCLVAERNGSLIRSSKYIESDICVLYYDGSMETITPKAYDLEKIKSKNPYQIWNFGPSLLDENGKALTKYSSGTDKLIDKRHPRAALGYYEPGHYSFIVVDGRSDDSQGVRMVQLGRLFEELGCSAAYNMDGGDSAQAYFGYTMIRGDEERGDDQRNLYDIICIGEVKKHEDG
jgi:exopolysaccharide biosynthesis protein